MARHLRLSGSVAIAVMVLTVSRSILAALTVGTRGTEVADWRVLRPRYDQR